MWRLRLFFFLASRSLRERSVHELVSILRMGCIWWVRLTDGLLERHLLISHCHYLLPFLLFLSVFPLEMSKCG